MMCSGADKTVEGADPGILIFGGTTEGRLAVRVCDAAGKPYWYSTRGELQQIECRNGEHITGAMDCEAMTAFCASHGIRLIIDAAHPFAAELHRTVADVAESLDLPVVRVERNYPERDASVIWCDSYDDAMAQLEADGIDSLLALTGVQTISKLEHYWEKHTCYFRILHRKESMQKALEQGFDPSCLVYYEEDDEASLIEQIHPQAILTKESGESGGFGAKVDAARKAGIPVYSVKRPALPASFETVTGEIGLRKAVERLAPGFFALRSGFTTGACATAAAKAALMVLLRNGKFEENGFDAPSGIRLESACGMVQAEESQGNSVAERQTTDEHGIYNSAVLSLLVSEGGGDADRQEDIIDEVEITFPNGERLSLPVTDVFCDGRTGTATVIKDAGDDPDVTNGISVVATVAFADRAVAQVYSDSSGENAPAFVTAIGSDPAQSEPRPAGAIRFLQGEGVGRVTLPGLGLEIGGPAINRVPREMMTRELSALYSGGLDVTISVPGGRELARRTFNPKLGVVDGISIIGTSGVVRPFSNEAFVEALRREVEVAVAVGVTHLIINSGAKSEAYLKQRFPDAPAQAFIHYGNFIGETLKIAAEAGIREITMGIMMGKAVKLAEGHLDTHSKNVVMNKAFLKGLAAEAGCSPAACDAIDGMTLARELQEKLSESDLALFTDTLLQYCNTACETAYFPSAGLLHLLLLTDTGEVLPRERK